MPFEEAAFLLIFKGERDDLDADGFIEYLQGLGQRLEKSHQEGMRFKMSELPLDHPARIYASGLGAEGT